MAMQNLRDKLLKAGLVDKKQKQQSDIQDRREKKQKGIDKQAEEEAERQRLFAERQAAEAEEQRRREEERAAERRRHEQQNRVRNICDRWAVRSNRPGKNRFYFVQRDNHIGYLMVSEALHDQLLQGSIAVVERMPVGDKPGIEATEVRHAKRRSMLDELRQPQKSRAHASAAATSPETHVLLPPDAAERVQELDPIAVRFWARTGHPIGYIAEPAS